MRVVWQTIHKSWNDVETNTLPNQLWRVITKADVFHLVGREETRKFRLKKAWEQWQRC